MPRVLHVNVSTARPLSVGGDTVSTGIFKEPVEGPQRVDDHHVAGDVQCDTDHHGGPWQAVYAYASEDTEWWTRHLDRDDLGPGTWGENLTLEGVDVSGAVLGTRWRIGTAVLVVTAPRIPCARLAAKMGVPRFTTTFARASRPGAYLAIDTPGEVSADDPVEVRPAPDHGVTVREVADTWHRLGPADPAHRQAMLERILAVPDLAPTLTAWAVNHLGHLR